MKNTVPLSLETENTTITADSKQAKPNALIRQFLALCDRLFGSATEYETVTRKTVLLCLGVTLLASIITVLRRIDAITNPQFSVEDGTLLFKHSLLIPLWDHLTNLTDYAGYPYILQKLLPIPTLVLGIDKAPLLNNLVAIAIAATTSAWFCLPQFRHIIRNDYLRVIFCLILVSLPNSQESVSVLTDMGIYFSSWLFLVSIMQLPRNRLALGLLIFTFLLAAFSTPSAFLVAPIWLVRLGRAWLNRTGNEAIFAVSVLVSEIAVLGITAGISTPRGVAFSLPALFNVTATRVVSEAIAGSNLLFSLREHSGTQIIYWITGLTVLAFLGLSWFVRFRNFPVLLLCAYISLSSVVTILLGRGVWNQFGNTLDSPYLYTIAPRYFMLGNSMVYLAFFATLDLFRPGRVKLLLNALLLAVIGFAIAQTFILEPFEDLNWKSYAQQISTKLATGDNRLLLVPINPGGRWGWFIPIGTPDYAPEVKIDPQLKTGELVGNDEFSQTFVSKCANLTGLEVYLSTYNRTTIHPINFLLKDLETGQIVVEREIGGPQVVDNAWRTYYFFPLENSAGHHYTFTLLSPLSVPGNAITIWRSQGDAYPDGEAFVNGQPLKADFVFRYICQ